MTQKAQEPPILTVTQLTNAVKHTLESNFPSIWLQGEISNFKKHSSGHLYFSLKDDKAQIAAVMFRGAAANLKSELKDGDSVIVYGGLNVYPSSGRYQIVIQELRLAGIGELLLKLEELKKKLHKMGWFSQEHKKPIPKLPKKIGVVTSPTGAAIQDILNVLKRRFSGFHLILNPVKVQGDGAAKEIARAIQQFNELELVDVIIVGRGGGSIEDLWAFNEEIVAEAIFNSKIPIIAAVGHETDHCIAEYVADLRAPTPSAAAELVIAEKSQQITHLGQLQQRLTQTLRHHLKNSRSKLEGILRLPLFRSPYDLLGQWIQKLDHLKGDIDSSAQKMIDQKKLKLDAKKQLHSSLKPTTQIAHFKQKLNSLSKQVDHSIVRKINAMTERLAYVVSALKSIDPKNLLSRGYSIIFAEKDRAVIKSVRDLSNNQTIRLLLSDGEALTKIEEVYPSD